VYTCLACQPDNPDPWSEEVRCARSTYRWLLHTIGPESGPPAGPAERPIAESELCDARSDALSWCSIKCMRELWLQSKHKRRYGSVPSSLQTLPYNCG